MVADPRIVVWVLSRVIERRHQVDAPHVAGFIRPQQRVGSAALDVLCLPTAQPFRTFTSPTSVTHSGSPSAGAFHMMA